MDYLELDQHRDQARFDAFWDECRDYPEDHGDEQDQQIICEDYSDEF